MDIKKTLKAFVDRQIAASDVIIEIDRIIATMPNRLDEVREQVEAFNRDFELPKVTYDAIHSRLNGLTSAALSDAESGDATRVLDDSSAKFYQRRGRFPLSDDGQIAEQSEDANVTQMYGDEEDSQFQETIVPRAQSDQSRSVDTRLQAQLKPGDILKNRFVLEEILGVGGMSTVFRARDLRKEEAQDRTPHVAIKVLGPEFKNHPESLRVLQREAKKAQTLAHPNIVNVYDFDRDENTIFMTMEILEGQGLDKVIKAHRLGGRPLTDVLPIVDGIAQALAYSHKKNIVHSDLKPGNVYLTKDNTVKVLDFGIARAKRDATASASAADEDDFDPGKLDALTPAYASCEMLEGQDPDPRDDIYALGCITYELLTGRHPYARKSAAEARATHLEPEPVSGLKRRQWTALRAALAFDREQRISDVLLFIYELKPHKLPWKMIAALSIVVVGSLGGWSYYAYQNKELSQELGDENARRAPVHLSAEQKAKIKDLLDTGSLYMTLGQLAAPPGDSAFDLYQKVLAIDPRNAVALEGERKIARFYETQGQEALDNGNLAQAKTMIELGLYVRPADESLLHMDKELKIRQSAVQ